MSALNETHAPELESWVVSANAADTDFPIQNLPFGVFRRRGTAEPFRGGIAIGDQIVDLAAASSAGIFPGTAAETAAAAAAESLNAFMSLGPAAWSSLRLTLSRALRAGSAQRQALAACLVSQSEAEYAVPAQIGDYTDFYIGIHHATAVGKLFRPDQPLMPNYKWVPIGYHGRASSILVSGAPVPRPRGQTKGAGDRPAFGETRRLDFELELGFYIGPGNALGEPVRVESAEHHIFGVCLLNDWSARDIQAWEYQPLGPFLAKNFASTVSPWIVTMEALAPFRAPLSRPQGDPQPLPYLACADNLARGGLDIDLDVSIETAKMRQNGDAPAPLSRSNASEAAYWTPAQLVAHHTINGCNLRPGDLLGSGTLSGVTPQQAGSLLEITGGGTQPLALPNGERRTFLEDGDAIILRGRCARTGVRAIGFGECRGTVAAVPANAAARRASEDEEAV